MNYQCAWEQAQTGKLYWWSAVALYITSKVLTELNPFSDILSVAIILCDVLYVVAIFLVARCAYIMASNTERNSIGWSLGTFILPVVFWFLYFPIKKVVTNGIISSNIETN